MCKDDNNKKVPVIKPASSIKMIVDRQEEKAIKKAIKKLH